MIDAGTPPSTIGIFKAWRPCDPTTMTIVDLAVIISALMLLLSIVAMKIYARRTDVLSGRYFHNDRDQSPACDRYVGAPGATVTEPNPQARAFPFLSPRPARTNALRKSSPQTDAQTETEIVQLSFRCGSFLFAHAGIRPGVPIADQDEKDLLWIREDFLGFEAPFGVFVVHGHTPVRTPEMRSNRLNIDTGAFATGRLSCAIIEGSTIMALSTETEGDTSSAPVQSQMAPHVVGGPAIAP